MTTVTGTPFLRPPAYTALIIPIVLGEGQAFAQAVNVPALRETLDALMPGRVVNVRSTIDISDGVTTYDNAVGVEFESTPTQQEQDSATAAIAAHNPNVLTPDQQAAAYLAENLEYADIFIAASNALEVGIATLDPVTLAAYRALLVSVVQILVPLVGTRFETHFNRERTAQSLPPSLAINDMTLAQCAAFDNLLHVWLSARKIDVILARMA